jgi:hypothetical protein
MQRVTCLEIRSTTCHAPCFFCNQFSSALQAPSLACRCASSGASEIAPWHGLSSRNYLITRYRFAHRIELAEQKKGRGGGEGGRSPARRIGLPACLGQDRPGGLSYGRCVRPSFEPRPQIAVNEFERAQSAKRGVAAYGAATFRGPCANLNPCANLTKKREMKKRVIALSNGPAPVD